MPRVTIKIDREAVRRAALTGPDVRAALRQIAEGVASRAAGASGDEVTVYEGGKDRARVYVRRMGGGAAAQEAKDRALGRSLGGGE